MEGKTELQGIDKDTSARMEAAVARAEAAAATIEAVAARITQAADRLSAGHLKRVARSDARSAAAAAAQADIAFDGDDIYGTLKDPRGRARDILTSFANAAKDKYVAAAESVTVEQKQATAEQKQEKQPADKPEDTNAKVDDVQEEMKVDDTPGPSSETKFIPDDQIVANINPKDDEDLAVMFARDFAYWDESHFRKLPRAATTALRDALVSAGVPVKSGRTPAFKALAEYVRRGTKVNGIAAEVKVEEQDGKGAAGTV